MAEAMTSGVGATQVPERALCYLARVFGSQVTGPEAVWIHMRGEVRVDGRWRRFSASQWLAPRRGLLWRARIRVGPVWLSGVDRCFGGCAERRWKVCGLLPVGRLDGPDVTRSARGRVAVESILVPAFLQRRASWSETEDGALRASFVTGGEPHSVDLDVDDRGRLRSVRGQRWGDPNGVGWRFVPFGAAVESEARFGGLILPRRIRAGWWFGTDRFDREGEVFRAEIEAVSPA